MRLTVKTKQIFKKMNRIRNDNVRKKKMNVIDKM